MYSVVRPIRRGRNMTKLRNPSSTNKAGVKALIHQLGTPLTLASGYDSEQTVDIPAGASDAEISRIIDELFAHQPLGYGASVQR
jgi:hypothetical protein